MRTAAWFPKTSASVQGRRESSRDGVRVAVLLGVVHVQRLFVVVFFFRLLGTFE